MRIRTVLATGLALSCLAISGCGTEPTLNADPKAEALTDADKAALQAQLDQAGDAEKAQQKIEAANQKQARAAR